MTRDEMLIGWLCIFRLNAQDDEGVFSFGEGVRDELIRRGWIEVDGPRDLNGDQIGGLTESGYTVTDLHAAEWSIVNEELETS